MPLVWKDEYRIGHGELDNDHMTLFSIANEFSVARDIDAARTALAKLLDYANVHFAREEAVIRACGLKPDALSSHFQCHGILADRLRGLVINFGVNPTNAKKDVVKETAILLEMWIFNHVLKEDVKIKTAIFRQFAKGR